MALLPLLLFTVHTVAEDRSALRASCGGSADVVSQVQRGDPVEIRFALSGDLGTCYKVSVATGGKTVEGYLPANAITKMEAFEQGRQSAAGFDTPQAIRQDLESVRIQAHAGSQTGGKLEKASALLSANQPAEALAILERLLQANPKDPGLLAMAGMAAYQSDQAKSAASYWRASLDLAPNPAVERMLERAQREVDADRSGQKLVGIRVNFRYDDKTVTPEQAHSLAAIVESEFTRVSEQLGCRAEERITAVIQSRDAYMRTTGAAEWSGGQYDGRIRVALIESVPGPETHRAFAHEIVHACLARTGSWPAWLHEGLAQKLSGQSAPAQERAAVRAEKGMPTLEQMGGSWSRLSARNAQLAYAKALLAAELLYEHYGTAGVRSLLQNPQNLAAAAADLEARMRQ